MAEPNDAQTPSTQRGTIDHPLASLTLGFIAEQYAALAKQAAHKAWLHVDYLAKLLEGEANVRRDRATKSRIRLARFPVIKTLEQFRWDWPTRINRLQVQNHFRLEFIQNKSNVILLGGVGLGKTHLATALGYAAGRITGWPATNPTVSGAFCGTGERIAGFLYVGTPATPLEERVRPQLHTFASRWAPPAD